MNSETSTMEVHHSGTEQGASELKLKCAPEPSCVSMKSDQSIGNPPGLSSGGETSCVSMKSDQSIGNPPGLSSGGETSCVSMKSDQSIRNPPGLSSGGETSCVSMKSDQSIGNLPGLSSGGETSCVSMKSDQSIGNPPGLSSGGETSCVSMKSDQSIGNPPGLSSGGETSCVSMKSDQSIGNSPGLSSGSVPSDPENNTETELQINTGHLQQDFQHPVDDILTRSINKHKTSMKNKYENLFEGIKIEKNKTLLNRIYTQLYIVEGESEGVNDEHEVFQMEKIQKKLLKDIPINCSDIFNPLKVPEVPTEDGCINIMVAKGVIDKEPKVPKIRSVLTKGIAGIGKTVSVQKFILDWAECEVNQDVDLILVLPFRELNLIKDEEYSLLDLLGDFHPNLKDLEPKMYDKLKVVFIFDGLDESRIPLNFLQCKKVSDITAKSSVDILMTNLIRGDLLPSALVWITCRPAAANQIPPKYINRVTEIQGFNDPQKEEYFRKRISDQDQAQKIISHIKTTKSLHIMCHIPVFCWISATVLQEIIKQDITEIPKTLTEMYSHFLITQINMKNEKFEEKDEKNPKKLLESNRTMLLKLAGLAFRQLVKGNVMFYEEDLRESSIDVTDASVYSGIFTQIFREEPALHQRKLYCFVHLSFQEFLAAVYVFHCYENKNMEELQICKPQNRQWSEDVTLDELLKRAVNKAICSQTGHLDLFLRFLLGISLESNQRLLQGLLTQINSSSEKTTEHIKRLIKDYNNISTERSINLFLCLSEVNDQSLSREIQEYLKSENQSEEGLSPGQCSALVYMLLTNEEVLDELNLRKFRTSEEGYRSLIPAVTVCRKAILVGCYVTQRSCETISYALKSENSHLTKLDLSNNDLQDSGVVLLSAGLESSHCKLEILRLAGCNFTAVSCEKLTSSLQSVNSSLKELDLSNNDLQDSGVKLLSAGLESSHCKLETLRLTMCSLREKACEVLGSVLLSGVSSLRELDLSNNDLQDSGVKLISAGLRSSHCKLETLRMSGCMVTEDGCSSLASALKSNPSHLRDLDLTYNHPGESGVKELSDLLEDPLCKLEKLHMDHGGKLRMKPGLKKYSCYLTLDPNTAHTELALTEGNRRVECVREDQPYPDHPDRFDEWYQVMSVESLIGRCYWEAELSRGADISITYRGTGRKGGGEEIEFGKNDQSWSLHRYNNINDISYSVCHNDQLTHIPDSLSHSSRAGVYLDSSAGTLTFYSVSPDTHTLTHLHTFTNTFSQPLYAGIGVYYYNSSVRLCDI